MVGSAVVSLLGRHIADRVLTVDCPQSKVLFGVPLGWAEFQWQLLTRIVPVVLGLSIWSMSVLKQQQDGS